MKKVLIAAFSFFALASCGNDDDTTTAPAAVLLPKSGVDIDEDGTLTSQYEYDGNKPTRSTWSDDTYETYTYADGKLQHMDYYMEGVLTVTTTFAYDGNKLASVTSDDFEYQLEDVIQYTYEGSSTVKIKGYIKDLEYPEDPLQLNDTGVLT
ncbi:MAG: hypothetical protein V4581_06260, partial [Bacteroidota bacterium]